MAGELKTTLLPSLHTMSRRCFGTRGHSAHRPASYRKTQQPPAEAGGLYQQLKVAFAAKAGWGG
jgi:hypothetical protein